MNTTNERDLGVPTSLEYGLIGYLFIIMIVLALYFFLAPIVRELL